MKLYLIIALIIIVPIVLYIGIQILYALTSETRNMPDHKPEHPGISDVTIYGNKDIICPKCNSPYCQCHFETRVSDPEYTTRLKFHPFNPFKPLVEKKTTVYRAPDKQIKKYRCTRCGWIFR